MYVPMWCLHNRLTASGGSNDVSNIIDSPREACRPEQLVHVLGHMAMCFCKIRCWLLVAAHKDPPFMIWTTLLHLDTPGSSLDGSGCTSATCCIQLKSTTSLLQLYWLLSMATSFFRCINWTLQQVSSCLLPLCCLLSEGLVCAIMCHIGVVIK
jgi:hypothetical protein